MVSDLPQCPDTPDELYKEVKFEQARAAAKKSSGALIQAAAAAKKAGLLSDEDTQRIRHALKLGRSSRATAARLQLAVQECTAITAELLARVPDSERPTSDGQPSRERRERRRHRNVRRTALNHVPRAGGAHSPAPRAAPQVTLAELSEDTEVMLEIARRAQLVRVMDSGQSAREALITLGIVSTSASLRWAQRVYRQWKGTGTVIDRRWVGSPPAPVMVPAVQAVLLKIWNGRRGANMRGVHRMLEKEIRRRVDQALSEGAECTLRVPTYETVRDYIRNRLPEAMRMVRDLGMEAWDKQARLVVDYDPTTFANELWQIDHCRLKIWVRVETAPGVWEPAEVWLTVAIDVHSRAIMGWHLAPRVPTAWTTAVVMRHAVLPKQEIGNPLCGLPAILTPDHGKDFKAHAVALSMEALGVQLDFCPPYYPNMKGEVERWFRTLDSYLRQLTGHMAAIGKSRGAARQRIPVLLTPVQLRAEIGEFIRAYHSRVHRAIGETPVARWERTVRLAMVSESEMNVLLLKADRTRKINHEGVSFTIDGKGGQYVAEEQQHFFGRRVRIRYNPDDLDSILLFDEETSEYLCEAWLLGTKYSYEDVKRWRRAFRQGLRARTTAYFEEMQRDDHQSARAWDEAEARVQASRNAEAAASHPSELKGPEPSPALNNASALEGLLEKFRRRDRGEGAA